MVSIMIVDDQDIIRMGLRTILGASPELDVVAEAADGFDALAQLAPGRNGPEVDVLLIDLRMPGIDGVETIRRIRVDHGLDDLKILVLTTFDQDENVINAIRAGANGFFSKGASPADLVEGIVQIAEGSRALSPAAVSALAEHVRQGNVRLAEPEVDALFAELTPREHEAVEGVVAGLDNAEIAQKLFVSPYTVKTHVNRAMMKVGARDRGQLVSLAVRAGILP